MTTITDRIAGPTLAGPADADRAAAAASRRPFRFAVGGERELRLDLFRGLRVADLHRPSAAQSADLAHDPQLRISDATEIFIFISGYTAAFVYGRAMLEAGFVVATARILRRVWQIYVAHVFLFTIFLAEISYVAPVSRIRCIRKKWESWISSSSRTSPSSRRCCWRFRPVNMDDGDVRLLRKSMIPIFSEYSGFSKLVAT